ncbi:alpha-methylacyl-CoA racemase-like [Oppia nitens]|uniref:alpha-methylacyl-CoA racemase-like n=1 Tax=Oppia nitens TaxID=1686743 RepID=UPI0023DB6CFC|nr:alpha-methylacyl-CoA racemase-like [Oppia nitens]
MMALKGYRVVELVGLAPAPFCGLILSDFGAQVIRVDRPHSKQPDCLKRGKKSFHIDLKSSDGKQVFRRLTQTADVVIEPFRPGVMENLGLGPKDLMTNNEKLIYARLTGYGQTGPMAKRAGHDINYLALSGILSILGTAKTPSPPINLLGDFAGGGLLCSLGICMALLERTKSGKGQVVDSSITEGTAYVSSWIWHSMSDKSTVKDMVWLQPGQRERNLLDGGTPFYRCYLTKDNKHMAVGALEPQFYDKFTEILELDTNLYNRYDFTKWHQLTEKLSQIFATKTQKEWIQVFDGTDACVSPVLEIDSVQQYGHHIDRQSFFSDGTPKPSPILSRTPTLRDNNNNNSNEEMVDKELLIDMGYTEQEINLLVTNKTIEIGIDFNSKL